MSHRREPRTLAERVAALEEQQRSTQTAVVVAGTGVASALYGGHGVILVGREPGVPDELELGSPGQVLMVDLDSDLGAEWTTPPWATTGQLAAVAATAADAQLLTYLLDEA